MSERNVRRSYTYFLLLVLDWAILWCHTTLARQHTSSWPYPLVINLNKSSIYFSLQSQMMTSLTCILLLAYISPHNLFFHTYTYTYIFTFQTSQVFFFYLLRSREDWPSFQKIKLCLESWEYRSRLLD